MTLWDTRREFEQGNTPKPQYIERMHELHRTLFDYAAYLPKTDIAEIRITDGRVIMTSRADAIRMVCDPRDRRTAPVEILNFGQYESEHSQMMLSMIRPADVVFDVGANIGWYSILMAKRIPSAQVHSFEPIPGTFARLRENIALNGLANVQAHNWGLSDAEKDLTFYFEPNFTVRASSANLADSPESAQKITCRVRPLDDMIGEIAPRVDFIKCDCEGAELFVFQGAKKVLKQCRPIVFTEMLRKWAAKFGYHPNQIIDLFAELNYSCYMVRQGGLEGLTRVTDDTADTNFFFLHNEKHKEQACRTIR